MDNKKFASVSFCILGLWAFISCLVLLCVFGIADVLQHLQKKLLTNKGEKNPSVFSFHMQTRFKLLNSPLLGEEK